MRFVRRIIARKIEVVAKYTYTIPCPACGATTNTVGVFVAVVFGYDTWIGA